MASRTPRTSEQKLHMAVIAVAAVLALGMVGAAAWALTRPLPPGAFVPPPTAVVDTSTATAPATSPAGVTTTSPAAPATVSSSVVMPPPPSGVSTTVPSAGRRIAFHLGKTLYISSENGKFKTPMHVTGTNYALSPDGRSVAAIEDGKLMVASVGQHLLASSPATPGLTAEAVAPVWLPDSSAVLFVRADKDGTAHIWTLNRASGAASEFVQGAGVAVAPDSQTVAVLPTEDVTTPTISVSRLSGGAGTTFQVPSGEPVAIAIGRDRVFVSTVSAAGSSAIWSVTYDGKKKVKLVGDNPAGSSSVTYGELMLSPDGKKLLFAADGDDGYSRLWTVPTSGGTPTAISGRRDGYALGWSKDGKGIIFIEGNAFQGQTTSLWLSDLKGRHRTKLVEGATL